MTFKVGQKVSFHKKSHGMASLEAVINEFNCNTGYIREIDNLGFIKISKTKDGRLETCYQFLADDLKLITEEGPRAFKAGDKVRTIAYCSGVEAGVICELKYGNSYGNDMETLFAHYLGNVCSCQHNWQLIEETPDYDFKVGDEIEILESDLNGASVRAGFISTITKVEDGGKIYYDSKVSNHPDWYVSADSYNKIRKINKQPLTPTGNKIMGLITKAFQSKENKALEHFGLGSTTELNDNGRKEYTNYIFETGDTNKEAFFQKIVELYKEETKK